MHNNNNIKKENKMEFSINEIKEFTKKVFCKYDLNSDDYIDREELENMINCGLKELASKPLNKLELDTFMEKYDVDLDDKLDLNEVTRMFFKLLEVRKR